MPEPTFTEVFGSGSQILNQGATTPTRGLFIPESALIPKGLATLQNARAESVLVALLLTAQDNLSEIARSTDVVNRNVTIVYQGQDLVNQGSVNYRRDAFSLLLYRTTSLATINPTDY